jgi:hypothetical protein
MDKGKSKSTNWGGQRENAGRKSIWKHKETCTIRIPQVFALKLHEIAQRWDKDSSLEFDINSKGSKDEEVSHSSHKNNELETESSMRDFDSVTKTNRDLSQAIDLARQILRHKKSARISLAKFLSKFYNIPVQAEDLK